MLGRMRLVVDPADDDGFQSARDAVLVRFEGWLGDQPAAPHTDASEMAGDVGLALDWKWSYGDGHLGRWTTSDIGEFLLGWCPLKLSVSPAECATIPASLATFAAFLGDQGLLAPGSSPVEQLAAAAIGMTDDFVAAMGDESKFGMAKSIVAAALAEGIDIGDPDELQEWIAEFNTRPEEDRRQVLPGTALG